jgi:hypothetical protein
VSPGTNHLKKKKKKKLYRANPFSSRSTTCVRFLCTPGSPGGSISTRTSKTRAPGGRPSTIPSPRRVPSLPLFSSPHALTWRIIIQVSEDLVLSDPAGLHLGAGPYMLMYSRRQSAAEIGAPIQWPPLFVVRSFPSFFFRLFFLFSFFSPISFLPFSSRFVRSSFPVPSFFLFACGWY